MLTYLYSNVLFLYGHQETSKSHLSEKKNTLKKVSLTLQVPCLIYEQNLLFLIQTYFFPGPQETRKWHFIAGKNIFEKMSLTLRAKFHICRPQGACLELCQIHGRVGPSDPRCFLVWGGRRMLYELRLVIACLAWLCSISFWICILGDLSIVWRVYLIVDKQRHRHITLKFCRFW